MMNKKPIVATALTASFILALAGPLFVLAAGPAAVNLGTAGNFVILSKTGISTTGATAITGDIGVSPIAASAITGFSLTLPAASAFSTSALVTGKVYASDYANPTPANLTTAVLDMQTAYTDAAGRASTVTELGAGNIGGLTLAPGIYKWGTGVTIPTDVTLAGGAHDVWIFQIAKNLTTSSGTHIVLSGGAQAANIFWQVAGKTTIGTTAVFNGNILDQTAIVLNTGARLNGRALAQTQVTLDSNAITIPSSSSAPGALAVTSITPTKSNATADNTFEDGWSYTFNITVPANERNLTMKFSDWLNSITANTIPAGNNVRISSAQADNAGAEVPITAANVYSMPALHLTGDLSPSLPGLQVQVTVRVKVPEHTANGSYTTNYTVQTAP
ncbi:MAG: ice-binding family protein [Minisyncoccota bacterium]